MRQYSLKDFGTLRHYINLGEPVLLAWVTFKERYKKKITRAILSK